MVAVLMSVDADNGYGVFVNFIGNLEVILACPTNRLLI